MTQTLTKRASQVDLIEQMLARVEKKAAARTEAGGYQGETTHPVKSVDDRTTAAREGSRSSENTSDVKEDQGSPSVDSTSPGTPGGQDSVQMNIGTQQSATGEDSSVETESAKGGKEDASEGKAGPQGRGDTSHPARTDNDQLQGGKYASAQQVLSLVKVAQTRGTSLLAAISVEADESTKKRAEALKQGCSGSCDAGTGGAAPAAAAVPKKDEDEEAKTAAQAGYDLAEAIAKGGFVEGAQKEAQDQLILGGIRDTVATAFDLAEKTAQYLDAYRQAKQAAEAAPPPEGEGGDEDGDEGAPGPGDGDGDEGPTAGGEGGGGGGEEQALLDLLASGEGMGGEEAMGGMAGGAGGGGGGDQMAQLQQLLAQLPPEQLQQLLAGRGGGGAPGGAPCGAPGGDPGGEMGPPKTAGAKTWQPKTAAEAQQLQQMVAFVRELTQK